MKRRRAFTLIELLVAMAVLALILVMMLQVTSGILASTRAQNRQMDSVAAARQALDVMTSDLSLAVVDQSKSVLVPTAAGSSQLFTLYAIRRGPSSSSGTHRFLGVSYSLDPTGNLTRSFHSLGFDSTSGATNTSVLAGGILGFEMRAITKEGKAIAVTNAGNEDWVTQNYNGIPLENSQSQALLFRNSDPLNSLTNFVTGLELWVVAADPKTIQQLDEADQLNATRLALANKPPDQWRHAVDEAAILPQAKSAIRILQKTISMQ